MRFFRTFKCRAILLGSCIFVVPPYAQVKDTAQQNQDRSIQQTAPAPAPEVPAVQYLPATQYAPATTPPPQTPQQTAPVRSDYFCGKVDGESAGKAATVGAGWFLMGCCGGAAGVLIPYVLEPDVASTEAVMGKSGEYIAGYNDGYKTSLKGKRVKSAFTGCIITGAVCAIYYVVMIVLLASSGV